MIYSIKTQYIEEKMVKFYQKLIDGTISNQKPDGQEIVASMKCAKITGSKTIQWSEMCFCNPPLKHEKATVYDHYFTNLETKIVDDYMEFDGESFFDFMEKQFKR